MLWELFLTYVLQNVLHNVCIQQNFLECLDCNNHHTINYNISCRPPRVGLRSGKNMVVVAGPGVLGQMLSSALL